MKTPNELIEIAKERIIESIRFKEENNWADGYSGFVKEEVDYIDICGTVGIIIHLKETTHKMKVHYKYINDRQFGISLGETRVILECYEDESIQKYPNWRLYGFKA